mmetsp:Transcript_13870/g.18112  ORF Transcript_13870/g.18112 Transcript_13870/m.18112 type:complete len:208 (+) Transcript_13870:42-665(+)
MIETRIASHLSIDSMILAASDRSGTKFSMSASVLMEDDRVSLAETESSAHEHNPLRHNACDACPGCQDVCAEESCRACAGKAMEPTADVSESRPPLCIEIPCNKGNKGVATYTMCQVKRHNTAESAWIIAGNDVYDITSYVEIHPGGASCLLRRAGGRKDCSEDFKFHSTRGQKAWTKYKIGRLVECCPTTEQPTAKSTPWWMYWNQ